MKKTTYKCDRCGAELGEDSTALRQQRFVTEGRYSYRLKFFYKWQTCEPEVISWELCECCRESLDRWIELGDV
jgi:hypothetical protein